MGLTAQDLIARLTTPYNIDTESGDELPAMLPMLLAIPASNNFRLMSTFATGYWEQIQENIDDFREQLFPKTMTGGVLDRYALSLNLLRRPDESDASFRIRIQGEIRKRLGATHADAILEFVETALGAQAGNVKIFENDDSSGATVPAYFEIEFSTGILQELGFDPPFTQIIADIEDVLDRVSAAGVRGRVRLLTGAIYDDPGAIYDDADTVYGT